MGCYHHPQTDAQALCKHCHKLLCRQCAVDSGWGLVCSDECKQQVLKMRELVALSDRQHQGAALASTQLLENCVRERSMVVKLSASLGMLLCLAIAVAVDRHSYDYGLTFAVVIGANLAYQLAKTRNLARTVTNLQQGEARAVASGQSRDESPNG